MHTLHLALRCCCWASGLDGVTGLGDGVDLPNEITCCDSGEGVDDAGRRATSETMPVLDSGSCSCATGAGGQLFFVLLELGMSKDPMRNYS